MFSRNQNDTKTWFITGCSRGLGREIFTNFLNVVADTDLDFPVVCASNAA
jgi:hypothetical protein